MMNPCERCIHVLSGSASGFRLLDEKREADHPRTIPLGQKVIGDTGDCRCQPVGSSRIEPEKVRALFGHPFFGVHPWDRQGAWDQVFLQGSQASEGSTALSSMSGAHVVMLNRQSPSAGRVLFRVRGPGASVEAGSRTKPGLGVAIRNKELLGTSALLLVTSALSALLVVTKKAFRNKNLLEIESSLPSEDVGQEP